jgi:hypothetical protein
LKNDFDSILNDPEPWTRNSFELGDIDGDGDVDILVWSGFDDPGATFNIRMYESESRPGNLSFKSFEPSQSPWLYGRLGDMNNDSLPDLVVIKNGTLGMALGVALNNGSPLSSGLPFEEPREWWPIPGWSRPTAFITYDLDADGDLDVSAGLLRACRTILRLTSIVLSHQVVLWVKADPQVRLYVENRGNATHAQWEAVEYRLAWGLSSDLFEGALSVSLYDYDNDGDLDLLRSSLGALAFFENQVWSVLLTSLAQNRLTVILRACRGLGGTPRSCCSRFRPRQPLGS